MTGTVVFLVSRWCQLSIINQRWYFVVRVWKLKVVFVKLGRRGVVSTKIDYILGISRQIRIISIWDRFASSPHRQRRHSWIRPGMSIDPSITGIVPFVPSWKRGQFEDWFIDWIEWCSCIYMSHLHATCTCRWTVRFTRPGKLNHVYTW